MDEMLLKNMIVELRRGTQIIAVLNQLKKQQYGYSLLKNLNYGGVMVEAGTLYPLLRRLETQGLLNSEWDTSEKRPRKYYIINGDGKQMLKELNQEWQVIVKEIDKLMGEKQNE